VMQEKGMFPPSIANAGVDLLVVALEDGAQPAAFETAASARLVKGLRVDLYPDIAKKLDKVFRYVDQRKAKFLAIIGGDEVSQGTVSVRDVATRTQETIPRAALAEFLASRLMTDDRRLTTDD
jgi:histidyl-tRNA synthetase